MGMEKVVGNPCNAIARYRVLGYLPMYLGLFGGVMGSIPAAAYAKTKREKIVSAWYYIWGIFYRGTESIDRLDTTASTYF